MEILIYVLIAIGTLLLLLRFGKILLIVGGLVVAGIIGLALYEHAHATRQALQAATISAGSLIGILIFVLLLVAVGISSYLYLRWKLAEKKSMSRLESGRYKSFGMFIPGPTYWRRRQPEQIVYIVESNDDKGGEDNFLSILQEWGF